MRAARKHAPYDARASYEAVHNHVLARVRGDEEVQYLASLFALPENATRHEYYACAQPFLNERECRMLDLHLPPIFVEAPTCMCSSGGEQDWDVDEARGERCCRRCGVVQAHTSSAAKYRPYDRTARSHHAYRRITHFVSVLSLVLTKWPPRDILECVQEEVRRQRVDVTRLTHMRLREIMRKVGQIDYGLAPSLLLSLQGKPFPKLSVSEISTLYALFEEVQRAFERSVKTWSEDDNLPANRHNFLSYPFMLRKCLLLLGREDVAQQLPTLKTPSKQRRQQRMWQEVAKELPARWDGMK